MTRGQIGVEYLIVIGFVVFIVIGLAGTALYYSSGIGDSVRFNQIARFADKVISSAESVFYAGEPSRTEIRVYLPKGVNAVAVYSDSILFNVSTQSGENSLVYQSKVPIYGEISANSGMKVLSIVAEETSVRISEGE